MGIFNKIIKKLRGGAAAPNEHGPAVFLKKRAEEAKPIEPIGHDWGYEGDAEDLRKALAGGVKITVVPATVSDKPGCACGVKCACGSKAKPKAAAKVARDGDGDGLINDGKKNEAKAPVVTPAEKAAKTAAKKVANAPVAKKPVSKSAEKRVAIQKDIAETPVPAVKKPAAKKPVAKPTEAKATPVAKKPAPKKK